MSVFKDFLERTLRSRSMRQMAGLSPQLNIEAELRAMAQKLRVMGLDDEARLAVLAAQTLEELSALMSKSVLEAVLCLSNKPSVGS